MAKIAAVLWLEFRAVAQRRNHNRTRRGFHYRASDLQFFCRRADPAIVVVVECCCVNGFVEIKCSCGGNAAIAKKKSSNGEIALTQISSAWKGNGLTAAKDAAFEVGKLVAVECSRITKAMNFGSVDLRFS